jgi:glucose/arabinose dehydrogenase
MRSIRLPLIASLACTALLIRPVDTPPPPSEARRPPCAPDNGGLDLPEGFCALVVAENVGAVRHLIVAPNGDVLAALRREGNGVVALRDTSGDGRADLIERFGPGGASGIALDAGYLYLGTASQVVRWRWHSGQLAPEGPPETVVTELPTGGHDAHSLALGTDGALYVNLGSRSNSCQRADRQPHSPGEDPCPELETRGGIWRFASNRQDQRARDGVPLATGIRNAVALALRPGTGQLFFAMNGRDQLGDNWDYPVERNAELPAEEFGMAVPGADYGWPYCYYDPQQGRKVLAPEYGGDGREVGRCTGKRNPLLAFPAHWAPLAIAFYTGTQFPPAYRGGAFIAFHGSWNRAPLPQEGYRVVFVPFKDSLPAAGYRTFATARGAPTGLRPSGLAVGPDGSLYISADQSGKIWRVLYRD